MDFFLLSSFLNILGLFSTVSVFTRVVCRNRSRFWRPYQGWVAALSRLSSDLSLACEARERALIFLIHNSSICESICRPSPHTYQTLPLLTTVFVTRTTISHKHRSRWSSDIFLITLPQIFCYESDSRDYFFPVGSKEKILGFTAGDFGSVRFSLFFINRCVGFSSFHNLDCSWYHFFFFSLKSSSSREFYFLRDKGAFFFILCRNVIYVFLFFLSGHNFLCSFLAIVRLTIFFFSYPFFYFLKKGWVRFFFSFHF